MNRQVEQFSFAISLSVLNHLGRNLYRSFTTVLGEAISNAWDADAKNVWIEVDKDNDRLVVADDGIGMTAEDFQQKFLKVGFSKRKDGTARSPGGRPFIGRKGIGKLALLSCAEKLSIISRVQGGGYVGGVIDNSALDEAITRELEPDEYQLGHAETTELERYAERSEHGTVLEFDTIKYGINHTEEFLRRILALYFRFSLYDNDFRMHLNGKQITIAELDPLISNTEFLWRIGNPTDPLADRIIERFDPDRNEVGEISADIPIKGFIASVLKPRHRAIFSTGEKVGVDLFVNGRLRETNILRHIPTSRHSESYLYGQLHFDELDDVKDRFTSSREGIVASDPRYQRFLEAVRIQVLAKIVEQWDEWRNKHRQPGDTENPNISPRQRSSRELFNTVANDYELPKGSSNRKQVDSWIDNLAADAQFNFSSYAECFLSENLIREFIATKSIQLSPEARSVAADYRRREIQSKNAGNISIEVRERPTDCSFLAMKDLAALVDKSSNYRDTANLLRDSAAYKPMRDAVAHTARLTPAAKSHLSAVYENIKARLRQLLQE